MPQVIISFHDKPVFRKTQWFGEVEFSMFENLLLARQTTFGLINDRPISSLPSDTAWMGALCDLVRYNNLARTNGEYQKMVTSTMLVDVVSKTSKQLFGYGCVQRE